MPGIRGIKRCPCDANRVLGWSSQRKPLVDDFGDPIYTSFLHEAMGVVMPAVNAPYVVERGGVPVGGIPKVNANFAIGLPTVDVLSSYAAGAYESAISEVHGARVVYSDDGAIHVVYMLGKKYDVASGVLDWGDGLMSRPCAFVVANWETNENDTHYLPPHARFGLPQDAGVNWQGLIPYGLVTTTGGGYVWHPPCVGFSRDTVVISEKYRVEDGIGNVMRYRFSDDSWCVGFGESAATSSGAYICMPAQMSGDGQPWVLAKEYNTKQMFTGVWSNTLGYNQNNFPAPSAGPIADLPAVLTTAEQTNRLDNKQGWSETYLDWLPLAYTRRNGYDYILIKPQTVFGYVDPIYYDGRRQRWLAAYGYDNIYAFDNGDVVLASLLQVKYVNADGTERWTWECPQNGPGDPGAGSSETPFVSGNSECVQIKNVSLVGFIAPPPYQPLDNVQSASTAQLDNREWTPHAEGFREGAITLSREGDPPICVVHRSLDRNTYDYAASDYKEFQNYQMNFYATNETLDVIFDGNWGRPQSHRAFFGRQVGGMSFDCAPSCLCSCAIPSSIAY